MTDLSVNLGQIIIATLTFIVGPTVVLLIKYYLDGKKDKNSELTTLLVLSDNINDKLESVRNEFESDRVWVAQFHNGGHFYPSGKSMAKFSIIYESLVAGVSSLHKSYQNLPVNMFSKPLGELLNNDVLLIKDISSTDNYKGGMYTHSDTFSSNSQYLFSLKTLEGKFLGVMCVEYVFNKRILTDKEIESLRRIAASVGAILGDSLGK
jgi:hypothetical protein